MLCTGGRVSITDCALDVPLVRFDAFLDEPVGCAHGVEFRLQEQGLFAENRFRIRFVGGTTALDVLHNPDKQRLGVEEIPELLKRVVEDFPPGCIETAESLLELIADILNVVRVHVRPTA